MALPDRVRQVFGPYQVVREIERGGMGVVVLARHQNLDREVALKLILEAATPADIERFQQEARAAAQLAHPNIVPVFETGSANGVHYLAMEYVPGQSLDARLKQTGPLPLAEAAQIVETLAEALAYSRHTGFHAPRAGGRGKERRCAQ